MRSFNICASLQNISVRNYVGFRYCLAATFVNSYKLGRGYARAAAYKSTHAAEQDDDPETVQKAQISTIKANVTKFDDRSLNSYN